MGTSTYIVSHSSKTCFEIGGSWMNDFPEEVLSDRDAILVEIQKRLPTRSAEYTEWLRDRTWDVVGVDFDVQIVLEGGSYEGYREGGYSLVGTYFPLR